MTRCAWCNHEQPPERLHAVMTGMLACCDGVACAARVGPMMWGAWPGMPLPAPGWYCCLDPLCSHPREQVFNGGGG
jgi:hypothetical protein